MYDEGLILHECVISK